MAAINTKGKVSTAAGVSEKVTPPYYSDPQFAVFGGNGGVVTERNVSHEAGISKAVHDVSKEGIGTGGYDANFAIF